ncbi:MAG: NAD(P)H-hydrate dehydratase [Syntrophales bacterium]|jgi:NAD(P)H-hydrate epimerase|nr:NAD(P)H-hydrate dehydratase [Syntrophales bacterium]
MKIASVEQMRAMDRRAVEKLGVAEEILMENAGQAAAAILSRNIGLAGGSFIVVCGTGNNGGDGLVAARHIHAAGGIVKVYLIGEPKKFRGAAKINYEILSRYPVEIKGIETAAEIRGDVRHADAVVDAIFGTGLDREVGGTHREAIDLVNEYAQAVLSLDIPSGICGNTGEVLGEAVWADWTVAFGLPKIGNILYPGYEHCGELLVCPISFPLSLQEQDALQIEINGPIELPERDPNAHKGSMGEALFVAGAAGYCGAPAFAALSFLKAGGGYARLAAPASVVPAVAARGAEIVFVPQKETASGSLAAANLPDLLELAAKMDVVVVGSGLSLDPETQALVRELVHKVGRPLILDGDGLTAAAEKPRILKGRKAPTILTPHPGEMARLIKGTAKEIERNRIDAVRRATAEFGAVVVLKGAHSLIGDPDGRVYVNLSGNAGMATAGSGDVLAGTIAAMAGLGLPPLDAARKGVFLHGLAGDLAAGKIGEDGITASDILGFLPEAVKVDRDGLDEERCGRCYGPAQVHA